MRAPIAVAAAPSLLFLALLPLLPCSAAAAASSSPPSPQPPAAPTAPTAPKADAAIHDELRAFRASLLEAVNHGDIERQVMFFHPNAVVTWHNAEVSRGRNGVRAYLRRMLEGPHRVVDSYRAEVAVDELTILYGENVGISFGSATEHFRMPGGRTLDLPARWSATLVKDGGRWLIASLHASDNLFDNPLLAMATRTIFWTGGAALVLGALAGMMLGRRGRRGSPPQGMRA